MGIGLQPLPEIPDEREGEYLWTTCHIWFCGDDHCFCQQVVVERVYRNKLFPRAFWFVTLWRGTFTSDGFADYDYVQPILQRELEQARREVNEAYPNERWAE